MPVQRYSTLAAYNAWANRRLYAAATALGEEACARPAGAFFGSILNTLNHLVVADRIWLGRFEGIEMAQPALDTILAPTLAGLFPLRAAEDARFIRFIAGLDAAGLAENISYTNSSGARFQQSLASALDHVFNHQTHHRGQAHALVTLLGGRNAGPVLDLIAFQREQATA
ncbi:DinB family protein [Xanthobacter autotrophicus DSM 431]|uniref:DinB family protein n=1 Tax=Xanthobacter nonsaccharivorans TaxID=3119912 RepID=UPI00372965EF